MDGYNTKVVEELLEADAKIDAKNKDGYTPLHGAAKKGHLQVVKYLRERDAKFSHDRDLYIVDAFLAEHLLDLAQRTLLGSRLASRPLTSIQYGVFTLKMAILAHKNLFIQ